MFGVCGAERGEHDQSSDAGVRGDREGLAGVVVEPGDDLDIDAGGEAVVGEVGLPGFIRLFGFETDVGGLRLLLWFGSDLVCAAHDSVDRRSRDRDLMVMFEVPDNRVGASIEALAGEFGSEPQDQFNGRLCCCVC